MQLVEAVNVLAHQPAQLSHPLCGHRHRFHSQLLSRGCLQAYRPCATGPRIVNYAVDQVVPGHSMKPYGGIASPEERARIVDYLEESGRD